MRVHSYHTVSSIINERGSDKRVLRAFNQFLCNKKIQKRLNFQDFSCSYNIVKLLLTCNTIKAQIVLIKLSYTYNNVAMATAVHMDYTLPLKQGTSFQMLCMG